MSKVSIVMSTYNGEKYIKEQIDSILGSTYQDINLYISDDCSSDHTMEIINSYQKEDPSRIYVHRNERNMGYTLNFLSAVTKADSDYVMLCDQDDVWKKDKIELTLMEMKRLEARHGNAVPIAVFTDAQVVDEKLETLHPSFFQSGNLNPLKTDLPHILMENKLIGCTVMINQALRDILAQRPLPRHARYHDWWIALIAAALGEISFLPKATLLYRQHGNNVVGDQSFLAYVKKRAVALPKQRGTITALQKQAEEFLALYQDRIPVDNYRIIHRFAHLHEANPFIRRCDLLRYGYLKTGFLRNVGLMIIV